MNTDIISLVTGIPRWARIALAVVGAVGAFLLWNAWDNHKAIEQHEIEREAKAADEREEASEQRVVDAIRDTQNEEQLHEVIDNAPSGGEVSPAAHALACERLRRVGRVPPACGPEGGDGS